MWPGTFGLVLPPKGGPVIACHQNGATTGHRKLGSALWDDQAKNLHHNLNNAVLTNRQQTNDFTGSAVGNRDDGDSVSVKRHD